MFKVDMYKLVKEDVKPWTEYLTQVLHRMNEGRQPIDYDDRVHGDDKVFPHKATGFTATESSKPENWLEVHTNMEIQARHRRKYPEIQVGDEVKVYKQKSVHTKEVVSDYPNNPVKVKKITKSLGQTFYEVEGESHPVIRADLILYKKGEGPVAEEEKEAVKPEHISYKRMRVRARVARQEAKAVKDKATADAKAAKDVAKAEVKAKANAAKVEATAKAKAANVEATAKAKAVDKAKKKEEKTDLLATAKRMRERSRANFAARIAIGTPFSSVSRVNATTHNKPRIPGITSLVQKEKHGTLIDVEGACRNVWKNHRDSKDVRCH